MAIVIEPEIGAGVTEVYSWLIERGDLEQAERYLRREPNALRRAFYNGVLHWAAGRERDAQDAWQRTLSMDPSAEGADVAAWIEAALRMGQPERALEVEDEITRGGPSLATSAAIMMALAHAMLGHDDEVADWLAEIERHLERGWPSLAQIDARRMRALRSLAPQPRIVEVLDRISERN
jgi:tetratricopeptide (TPR) repeat protein